MKVIINTGQEISMDDFISDNLNGWIAMRVNGASASGVDSPWTEPLLIKAFDEAVKALNEKRGK